MTVDHIRIVGEWKETKYIVVSSSFFMLTAIYGFYNNLYILSLISFVTSLISMNFWRHASYSWGRIADRIFSKISFSTFFYHSIKYASLRVFFFLQYAGMFTFLYYYYMSNKYDNTPIWWKYHIKFHAFCVKEIMDMTIDHTRIVAEWKETKYIVLSSSFFMVPAIYGYYNNLYLLPGVLLLTTLFSMNFWRHATYSWRRIADRTFAKISFSFFFINGVRHITYTPYLITGYTGTILLLYCYYMSNKYHHLPIWWKYHMMFHLIMSYNQFIIINSIVTKY